MTSSIATDSTSQLPTPTPASAPHPHFTGTRLFFLHLGLSPSTTSSSLTGGRSGSIMTCLPNGTCLRSILTNLGTHPDGLLLDPQNRHIYYSNMGHDFAGRDGSICRVDLDGSNNVVLVSPPSDAGKAFTPKQITLVRERDGEGEGKLYWCDREGGRVWRAGLDGRDVECLYVSGPRDEDWSTDEVNHCVGISVDSVRRVMYWTQKGPKHGGQGRLFCAGVDVPEGETAERRSDVRVLMEGLPEPIDLEFDEEGRVLYKTDRGAEPRGNTVSRVRLGRDGDGEEEVEEEVLVRHLHDAIGVAIDKRARRMYFTDIGGSVYAAGLDGSDVKEILKEQGDLTGIWCAHFEE